MTVVTSRWAGSSGPLRALTQPSPASTSRERPSGAAQRSGYHGPERDDVVQDEGLGQRAHQRLARSDPLLDQPVLHDPAEPAQLVDELVVVTRRPRLGKGPSDVALPEFAETGPSGQFGETLQVLGEGAIAGIGAEGEAARSVLAEGRHEQR